MKESFKSEPLPIPPSKVVVKATEKELRKVVRDMVIGSRWVGGWTVTLPPATTRRLRFVDSSPSIGSVSRYTKPAFKP